MRVWVACILVVVGMAGLLGGAHLMVGAAVKIASDMGVSQWLIGITVVAIGTSLPEVAAAIAAAYKGESDIVLGNVAGSNLFNILLILGTTVAVQPMSVSDAALKLDFPVLVGFSLMMLVVVATGMRVQRWEGAVLVACYAGFIVWQVMAQ
jgi:cation:H+ antiporter